MVHRQAMNLDQSIHKVSFVAFDFETTGLYPAQDTIVELGAVRFLDSKVVAEYQALVNPERPIPADAVKVSGISNEMVKDSPVLSQVLPGFMSFIEGSVLLAHNAGFDLGFLRTELERHSLGQVSNMVIDTLPLARKAFPGQKSYSLQNLAAFLNFPPNQAHRALDDSIMCMRLFLICAEKLSFMGEISLKEVLA